MKEVFAALSVSIRRGLKVVDGLTLTGAQLADSTGAIATGVNYEVQISEASRVEELFKASNLNEDQQAAIRARVEAI